MAQRLIRDGLLDSEAVLSLPAEARWLYVSILLSADDVGLFEATPFRLARRADIRRELADKLVQMLADVDLIRLYSVDGRQFGFIPKFGQRLQIKRARCPLPPVALLAGDSDAVNKINSLGANPAVDNGESRKSTAVQPPEPEPEPEPEEEKREERVSQVVGVSRARSTETKGLRLAADWQLPRAWGEWSMTELRMGRDAVRLEADKFRDYWHGLAGAKGRKADWFATWRNWCRNAKPVTRANGDAATSKDARDDAAMRLLGIFNGPQAAENVIEG